jgi:hypothetical protein
MVSSLCFFKCRLCRYTQEDVADTTGAGVGLYESDPVDPQLERRLVSTLEPIT